METVDNNLASTSQILMFMSIIRDSGHLGKVLDSDLMGDMCKS